MSRALLPALLLLAATIALGDPPPQETKLAKTGTRVEYLTSFQGSASIWTLFSDGRIQHVDHPLSSNKPRLRTSKLPAKVVAALLERAKKQKLDTLRFTQKEPGPTMLSEGVTRLTILGNVLERPTLTRPNAETKAISAQIEAFAKDLDQTFAPHLDKAHPAGTYVYAYVFPLKDQAHLQKTGKLEGAEKLESVASPRLRSALETPGLRVRLAEGEEVSHGQILVFRGRALMWLTSKFAGAEPKRTR